MSHIGQNIKKIRSFRKISQAEFASLFNLARPSVGAYEEGRAEPKIDTVIQIAKHFSLSIDLLLTKEITVGDLLHLGSFKEKLDRAHRKGHTAQKDAPSSVGVVGISDHVEYLVNFDNKDFIRNLPHISWPISGDGDYRIFEVSGREMEFNKRGIHHGDLLLAKKESKPAPESIVVLVISDRLVIRRLIKLDTKKVVVSAYDPNYPEETIQQKDINEIWMVEAMFSKHLEIPESLEEKVLKMEEQLLALASKVKKSS